MTTTVPRAAALGLVVTVGGVTYPAEAVARGAAYEIFSASGGEGFMPNPRAGTLLPFRRFVHCSDVEMIAGDVGPATDSPLIAPLHRALSWPTIYRMTQSATAAAHPVLHAIRGSAVIVRGTRMMKILSGRQLAGYLRGWLPFGFCHREYDIAHLRTPAELGVLRGDGTAGPDDVVFALRWRAVDPADYEVPLRATHEGLTRLSPHDRLGPPVLGTGFAPSGQHVIPEFVTAELLDLPMPMHAELVAFTGDGTEVLLYRYLAEQRAWGRLAGRQWYRLLDGVEGVAADQEYFPVPPAQTQLVGVYRGRPYEAMADPPDAFWLLAKVRALRHAVATPSRRNPVATWRGTPVAIVRDEGDWLRVRLMRPEPETVARIGAACAERGIYEAWAPAAELVDHGDIVTGYPYAPSSGLVPDPIDPA